MARIPVRFNRIAAAFNEAARAPPVRLCDSSGSDHSPQDLSTDLSDLVNSFIENNCDINYIEKENDKDETESGYWSESETKEMLKSLLDNNMNEDDDDVKQKILLQAELACLSIANDMSSVGFKRQLMSRLRDKGFDAGMCKSRWEKFGRHIGGSYEYVDVNFNGRRYIVEINLSEEFEIARPTTSYSSLIDVFPKIFVGKPEQVRQIVRVMCREIRKSMKSMDMKVPPWRLNGYMQAKWSAHYKRTTNGISSKNAAESENKDEVATKSTSVGFGRLQKVISYHCRDNFASKITGSKVGYLTAAFNAI